MIFLTYVIARVLGMPPTTIVTSWFCIVNNLSSGIPFPMPNVVEW